MGRVRARQPRRDDRLAELGDDPVPLRLDQPHDRLRVPRLVAAGHARGARRRHLRNRREHPQRRVRRHPALGRAVRGAADERDVRRDGVACAAPSGGDEPGGGARGDPRVAARAPGAVPPRRVARAAHAGDDRPRASRAAAARGAARSRGAGGARRAGADRAHRRAAAAAGEGRSARLRPHARRRAGELPRRRLHALVGGGAAHVAAGDRRGGCRARGRRGAAERARRAARERREVHGAARRDRAARVRRRRRDRDRGGGRGMRRSAGGARPDLRPLRAGGRRAHARAGRRRARALDRRRDRQGARRPLHRHDGDARRDLRACGCPCGSCRSPEPAAPTIDAAPELAPTVS